MSVIDLLASGSVRASGTVLANDVLQSNYGVLVLFDLLSRFPSVRAVAGDPNVLLEPGARGSLALRTDASPAAYVKLADTPNNTWVIVTTGGGPAFPDIVDNPGVLVTIAPANLAVTNVATVGQLASLGAVFGQTGFFGDAVTDGQITFSLGGVGGPTLRVVAGDPNGTIAVDGSLALDGNGKVWLKSGGAGVWTQLVAGGAKMFDVVNSVTIVAPSFATVDDVSLGGPLGNTTYVKVDQTGANYAITGLDASSAVDGSVIFLQSINGVQAAPTAWRLENQGLTSLPANRIISVGGVGVDSTAACQGGSWLRYDGSVSRWRVMEKV